MGRKKRTNEDVLALIDKTSNEAGCWRYPGTPDKDGYGRIQIGGKNYAAHRWFYEILIREIPEGLTLDHLCRNRTCVNPAHLEPVTGGENVLRGVGPSAVNALKLYGICGHPLFGDNLKMKNGRRLCRICWRKEKLAAYHRKQDERAA